MNYQNSRYFTSREYENEINLYYYRARYYDSNIGRFISRDPIGIADDVNLYRYVKNNPVMFLDPSGTEKTLLFINFTGDGTIEDGYQKYINYYKEKYGIEKTKILNINSDIEFKKELKNNKSLNINTIIFKAHGVYDPKYKVFKMIYGNDTSLPNVPGISTSDVDPDGKTYDDKNIRHMYEDDSKFKGLNEFKNLKSVLLGTCNAGTNFDGNNSFGEDLYKYLKRNNSNIDVLAPEGYLNADTSAVQKNIVLAYLYMGEKKLKSIKENKNIYFDK